MRILFVSEEHAATRGTGGIGSYIATISKALAQRGHDVHVLSCIADAAPADVVVDEVALHTRPMVRIRGLARVVPGPRSLQAILLGVSNYVHARRLGRFDVVEVPDWRAEGLVFTLRRTTPVVTHLHTPTHVLKAYNEEPQDRDARLTSWLERITARRSTAVTCPARLLVEELRTQGWLNRDVEIIRYPVDWRRFDRAGATTDEPPSILYVGRLEHRKAPERILYALADLRDTDVHATAVYVGRGSGDRDGINYGQWVEELATRLGVPSTFIGELPWSDVPELYARATVVCVPSRFESFSMTAAEGMAAARPVVVTDRVGAAELLAETDPPGQVCDGSPQALASAFATFLTDPEMAAVAGTANRETLVSACDPAEIARQREELFQRIAT